MIENVPGFASAMTSIRAAFAELGYSVDHRVLDAAAYGVAQHRRRLVVIARRDGGAIPFPASTHGPGRLPYVAASDAIDAPLLLGTTATEHMPLSPTVVERLQYIKPGESVWDAMNRLPPHLRIKGNGFPASIYRRLEAGGRPAYTVTGSGGGGTLIYHHLEDRALNNRERARLQGFDDSYVFVGTVGEIRAQIGNAVPPLLARAVAEALVDPVASGQRAGSTCPRNPLR